MITIKHPVSLVEPPEYWEVPKEECTQCGRENDTDVCFIDYEDDGGAWCDDCIAELETNDDEED